MASLPYRAPHFARHLLAHILPPTSAVDPFGTGCTSRKTLSLLFTFVSFPFPFVSLCFPLSPCCFPFVSLCFPSSPFVSLLFPFCLPLFPFCVPFVSLLSPCCLPLAPCCLPAVSLLSPCCLPVASLCLPAVSPVVPLLSGLVAGDAFILQLRRRCERIAVCLAESQHTRNCAAGPVLRFFFDRHQYCQNKMKDLISKTGCGPLHVNVPERHPRKGWAAI
jgi:hypothetical protein